MWLRKILIKIEVAAHLIEDSILAVSVVVKGVQHEHHIVCRLRNSIFAKLIFYGLYQEACDIFNFFICKFYVLIIISSGIIVIVVEIETRIGIHQKLKIKKLTTHKYLH
jgi:hypothetical protein